MLADMLAIVFQHTIREVWNTLISKHIKTDVSGKSVARSNKQIEKLIKTAKSTPVYPFSMYIAEEHDGTCTHDIDLLKNLP